MHPDPQSAPGPASPPPPVNRRSLSLATAVMLGAVYGFYALLWRDWSSFSLAIDQRRWLFNDFRFHFFPTAAGILETHRPGAGFYYSAFFALLLQPLAWLTLDAAARLWGALQVLLFAALCALPLRGLLRLPPTGVPIYLLLCATSYPALNNFKWGQVSVLLVLLTLASFDALRRGRSVLAGVLLALAASIKYYSGFFVLYFLLRRDWRAGLAFLATSGFCFALVPACVLGPSDWIAFHRETFSALADAQWVAGDPNSQYFAHVAMRWANGFSGAGVTVPGWLRAAGLFIALAALASVWRIRAISSPPDLALVASLMFVALPCLVTTSWPHYFAYLPFAQATAVCAASSTTPGRSAPWRSALHIPAALSILMASVPFFLLSPSWLAYQEKGFLLLADLLLLPPLLLAAFASRRSDA